MRHGTIFGILDKTQTMKNLYSLVLILPFLFVCANENNKPEKTSTDNKKRSFSNKSPSVFDAVVRIEANLQVRNLKEYHHANVRGEYVQELVSYPGGTGKNERAGIVYEAMLEIDKLTAEKIQLIDKVKLLIMQASKENLDPDSEHPICLPTEDRTLNYKDVENPGLIKDGFNGYYQKVPFVKPIRMALSNISSKKNTKAPMRIMGIDRSLEHPDKTAPGFAVWPAMKDYRNTLPSILVNTYHKLLKFESNEYPEWDPILFTFEDPNINGFIDIRDLSRMVERAFAEMKHNYNQDLAEVVEKLYMDLTKNEYGLSSYSEIGNIDVAHWIGSSFDQAPVVVAILELTQLQNEILAARRDAFFYLADVVNGGQYTYSAVEGRAFAPTNASVGEKVRMEVVILAFGSERQPRVEPDQGRVIETKNGRAIVEFTPTKSGKMKLSGTVGIRNKHDLMKIARYETTILIK